MPPAVGPRMQMYPPGGPPMGQQLFYGQGPPAMIPQVKLKSFKHKTFETNLYNFLLQLGIEQPGFGYQQQLVPGMRPGGSPMPNFFMPMMQQGQQQQQQQQQQQRPGGGRRGALPQPQQPSPMMQQQVKFCFRPKTFSTCLKSIACLHFASICFSTDASKRSNVSVSSARCKHNAWSYSKHAFCSI